MHVPSGKIIVTGADGFIGSHLVEHLVQQGCAVKAFVFYNSFGSLGWLDTLPATIKNSIEIFAGDIRDPYAVKKALTGCNCVMHLAALIGIPYSYYSPDTYVDTNIKGTLNVLQASRELNLQQVIHTSTSEVYGTAKFVPMTELHPLQGQSPYSASKIAADQLALSFYYSFKTPVTIIRPFNTYGPRQSARAIIPTVLSQIASGKTKLKIGSLTPTRDFTFVKDTVNAFYKAMGNIQTIGEVINVGSNFEISIGDLIHMVSKQVNKDIEIIQDNERLRPKLSEVERLLADNTKAKQILNWTPMYQGYDGFKKGLSETMLWFFNPVNLQSYKTNQYNV